MKVSRPPGQLTVTTDVDRGVALVSLSGPLDEHGVDVCEKELRDVEGRVQEIVLDLRAVSAIDVDGLGAIARAEMRSYLHGWRLVLVRARPPVDQVFRFASIVSAVRMVDSLEGLFPPAELGPLHRWESRRGRSQR